MSLWRISQQHTVSQQALWRCSPSPFVKDTGEATDISRTPVGMHMQQEEEMPGWF